MTLLYLGADIKTRQREREAEYKTKGPNSFHINWRRHKARRKTHVLAPFKFDWHGRWPLASTPPVSVSQACPWEYPDHATWVLAPNGQVTTCKSHIIFIVFFCATTNFLVWIAIEVNLVGWEKICKSHMRNSVKDMRMDLQPTLDF